MKQDPDIPILKRPCGPDAIAKDYDKGLLHLAWLTSNTGRRLIFAQFELYPPGFTDPEESVGEAVIRPELNGKLDPREQCINLPDKRRIYYIRALDSAENLVRLYLQLGQTGILQLFWMKNGTECKAGPMAFAPAWPCLALSHQENRHELMWTWPYIAKGWGDVRCQHCFAREPSGWLQEVLLRENPANWLKARLGWDIAQYPDLWGSAHLTLPNPLYGNLHIRAVPPEESRQTWQVHCEIKKRPSAPAAKLGLTFLQRGVAGLTAWPTVQVKLSSQQELYLDLPDEPEQIACLASTRDLGLLSFVPFTGFIRKIITDLNVIQQGPVRIEAEDYCLQAQRDGVETVSEFDIGDLPYLDGWGEKISLRQKEHADRHAASASGEQWFDDEKTARAKIAEILRPAKTVLIADPYFCENDLLDYVITSCNAAAEITILTSRKAFGSDKKEQQENAKKVWDLVQGLRNNGWKITVQVMGKNPAIHDRFLILDNSTVWYSGASLNHIGSKGCIIARLNDPALVIGKINAVLENRDRVKELSSWLGQHTDKTSLEG